MRTFSLAMPRPKLIVAGAALLLVSGGALVRGHEGHEQPQLQVFPNPAGASATYSAAGPIDGHGPFFQSLGTNGRACVTCHEPANGWSLSAADVRARFEGSGGLDPLFRPNDGADSPLADVSTVDARRRSYGLLLRRGVFRFDMPVPAKAEFIVGSVDDPYGYATPARLSVYRRPLPATNLRFLTTVMWDGRERAPGQPLEESLLAQAQNATAGHAQAAAPLPPETLRGIVATETALFTAQSTDAAAGSLETRGGKGGARRLARQKFHPGVNDPARAKRRTPPSFKLFGPWKRSRVAAQSALGRGEAVFNTLAFPVSGVRGLNDDLGREVMMVTCATCHNTPNVGSHSTDRLMDIGVSDGARRAPDLPLYTLRNRTTGEALAVTDPGRALVTGRWGDVGRFKVPSLRGLAARPPYFHDGSAGTLEDVVAFYVERYGLHVAPQERADLVAFLRAL